MLLEFVFLIIFKFNYFSFWGNLDFNNGFAPSLVKVFILFQILLKVKGNFLQSFLQFQTSIYHKPFHQFLPLLTRKIIFANFHRNRKFSDPAPRSFRDDRGALSARFFPQFDRDNETRTDHRSDRVLNRSISKFRSRTKRKLASLERFRNAKKRTLEVSSRS